MRRLRLWAAGLAGVCAVWILSSCGSEAAGPPIVESTAMRLSVQNLARLDPLTEGAYEAWVVDSEGTFHSAGRFVLAGAGPETIPLSSPIRNPVDVVITVEPPGDTDAGPSALRFMGGRVSGGEAMLDHNRYLTPGVPLEPSPGQHFLFTPSDNFELGYPSYEDAGIWVMNFFEDEADDAFFVTLTPLNPGWTYEGWVVKDWGTPAAIWVSYGKFRPDSRKRANTRDDTGLGPYSGQLSYATAMPGEIYFPGDDWLANPHGYPVPGDLPLPFDLNGDAAKGVPSRWTHVITIEPRSDGGESPWLARPFFIRPYRNPIGEGPADEGRRIGFHADDLPRGIARLES